MAEEEKRDLWFWILAVFAASNAANAVWMLVAPAHWYRVLPAGVPDFGPFNEHFVRDIGVVFLMMAIALAWAAAAPARRVTIVAVVSLFYVLHAALHVFDTARGFVGPEHWGLDAGGIYLPALLMVAVTWALARGEGRHG